MGARKVLGIGRAGAAGRVIPVGDTPMRAVDLVIEGAARRVGLKLEGHNPGGSIKDRTALSLIESLERRGALRPGSVVIDSTSGNLGVALAMIARARGYEFVAVVDPKTTEENLAKMSAMGAQSEHVRQPDEAGGYLLSRLARVRELCASSEAFVWTDQYSNPANPAAHFRSTGPEIYRTWTARSTRSSWPSRPAARWPASAATSRPSARARGWSASTRAARSCSVARRLRAC